MFRIRVPLLACLSILALATSCLQNAAPASSATPVPTQSAAAGEPAAMPWLAMKNTTRINTSDPVQAAVTVSQTQWPSTEEANRAGGVILTETEDWRSGLVAADLIHFPFNGPILFAAKDQIPEATLNELKRLKPEGAGPNKVQVIMVGNVPPRADEQLKDLGLRTERIQAGNPAALAAAVDEYFASMQGSLPPGVIVGSMDHAEYTMPAVNWIAHMPEPLLLVRKDEVPAETAAALQKRNGRARIYLLGPESAVSSQVEQQLKSYGIVTRIAGKDPYETAVAFAKFHDPSTGFGWSITSPGHNVSLVSDSSPLLVIAAAPFSHLGKHAPLLWVTQDSLPPSVMAYFMEIQPKYKKSPAEGPYNHAWLTGDISLIPLKLQGSIDQMLEITSSSGNGGGHGGH